eukprot:CAMPEP_0174875708 /NCGR_PEP_ID=MMETSP1114-20130205/78802_1 /TAXON_ID=312471 /ORGANISM="Neobodo designis, Strain CCAP 1951/1" /LENGTH=82 /DNA_ID=CAMNT_0016111055 /DNA_START=1 /DNA_END=245 /DNA_ORIENTATION=+
MLAAVFALVWFTRPRSGTPRGCEASSSRREAELAAWEARLKAREAALDAAAVERPDGARLDGGETQSERNAHDDAPASVPGA